MVPRGDPEVLSPHGLPLDRYLSLPDMLNSMHRLWSDCRWNKLTVAHGCCWKKCSLFDVSLDYIGHYDSATAETLVDRLGHRRRNWADGVSLGRRSGAAEVAESAGRRTATGRHFDQLAEQHPLLKNLHARAVPASRRQRVHRHQRRPGSGLGPPSGFDEKRRVGGPGGARHQKALPTPASWSTPT